MNKPDTTLQLGDFTFSRFEIPEHIPFGGDQKLIIHELVGGARVIDAMGATTVPIEWSGFFTGQFGLSRARYVDNLRKAGLPLQLAWSELSFNVLIKSFHCDFRNFYRIPYTIVCEVVSDLTKGADVLALPSIDDLINGDMTTANSLSGLIGDSTLTSLMSTLSTSVSAVSSFATAAQATLNGVLQPLAAVRTQANVLLTSATNTIQNVTTLGGILPNNPIANQSKALLGQISAVNQSPLLINLDRTLGRIQSNIGTVNNGGQTLTTVGGNLYTIASKLYGDAMSWTGIAAANKLTDPQLSGVQTLNIPPSASSTGGVPNV